jgi:hypothetical protein
VPVPLVHADRDQDLPIDMTKTYFSLLTGARYRRWVEKTKAVFQPSTNHSNVGQPTRCGSRSNGIFIISCAIGVSACMPFMMAV